MKKIDDIIRDLEDCKREIDEYCLMSDYLHHEEIMRKEQECKEREKAIIDKACAWLKRLPPQWEVYEDSHYEIDRDSIIEELRKYLED